MKKEEREQLKRRRLTILCLKIPAINNILDKAEDYITAYNKALKYYWKNGKCLKIFQKMLIKGKIYIPHSLYPEDRALDTLNLDLVLLNKKYKKSIKKV